MTASRRWLVIGLMVPVLAGGAAAWLAPGRGSGLLVVVLDEDAQVTVAGEGAVERGKGPRCEFRLPAGRYEVWARFGSQVGQEEWVDLGRDEEVEVRPQVPRPVRPAAQPFVLLARGGRDEQQFANLEEAIDKADPGDTIEVHGNGPFELPALHISRPLVLRAGPNFRPVLRLRPDARAKPPEVRAFLMVASASLVLEGLELDGETVPATDTQFRGLLRTTGPSFHLASCALRLKGPSNVVSTSSPQVHVRNCTLQAADWSSFDWEVRPGGRLEMTGCLITQGKVGFHVTQRNLQDVAARLEHNTILATPALEFRLHDVRDPPAGSFRVDSAGNIFQAEQQMVLVNQYGEKADGIRDTLARARAMLAWAEEGNVYPAGRGWVRVAHRFRELPGGSRIASLDEWAQLWGPRPERSVQGPALFAENSYRLKPDSPGRRLAPGGRDAGVEVDVVGPGPAYERWRRTEGYQAWRQTAAKAVGVTP